MKTRTDPVWKTRGPKVYVLAAFPGATLERRRISVSRPSGFSFANRDRWSYLVMAEGRDLSTVPGWALSPFVAWCRAAMLVNILRPDL